MKKSILNYLIPALLILLIFAACSSSVEEKGTVKTNSPQPSEELPYTIAGNDTIWTMVDQMAMFSGGDSALLSYLTKNTRYPRDAAQSGVEGRCIVRFCVTDKCDVKSVSIIQGVSPELDAEALRVVSSLPPFEYPALKHGKPASVWYVVPIQFRLN